GDRAFGFDFGGIHAFGIQRLGAHRRNVHGDVFTDLVGTGEINQHADTSAVNVAGQRTVSFKVLEATDGHVFANLANQRGTGGFHRAVTHGQLGKRIQICRVLFGDQLGQVVDEGNKIFVFGDKVSFAVNFDQRTTFLVV